MSHSVNKFLNNLNLLSYFPVEINDIIFQHVSGAELLVASEVSLDFYDFIANSDDCMKKIKIKLNDDEFNDNGKNLLIQSSRKYQNIEIAQFRELLEDFKEIVESSGRKFTNIVIKSINFESVDEVLTFFSVFEPTVETFRMDQVFIKSIVRRQDFATCNLKFPKLKALETKCCQALLYHKVFVNCTNLEKFVIKSGSYISESYVLPRAYEAIRTILRCNSKIEVLMIHFNIFSLIFNEDIAGSVHFKLRKFHANELCRVPRFYSRMTENFKAFLSTQIETLEGFSLGDWMGIDALKLIFLMPKLKKLTLKGFHNAENFIDWENCEISQNKSLESLEFHDLSNNFEILKKVISAAPNVKKLKLYSIDQTSMDFISITCKSLKKVQVEYILSTEISYGKLFKMFCLTKLTVE